MKGIILLIMTISSFLSHSQTVVKKENFDKDLSLVGFSYYKDDLCICSSIIDSVEKREIFLRVDKMPSFGDDTQDILKYIFENLDYSRTEEEIPFRGRIFVRFIVEPTGNLTHFVILKDYNSFYNEKAIHVIQMMVDWKPGECDGLKVPVFYIIPVSFSLN